VTGQNVGPRKAIQSPHSWCAASDHCNDARTQCYPGVPGARYQRRHCLPLSNAVADRHAESPPGKPLAETSSDELLGVLKRARDIAKNRDDQPVSVHDLLTALDGLPPDSPAAEPIRGGGKNGYVHAMKAELQNIVTSFAMQIREVMPQIQPQVFDLQISREFADLRGYLQSRDGALERLLVSQIGELRNSMPPERAPEPAAGANENAARDGAQPGWLQNVFGSGAR